MLKKCLLSNQKQSDITFFVEIKTISFWRPCFVAICFTSHTAKERPSSRKGHRKNMTPEIIPFIKYLKKNAKLFPSACSYHWLPERSWNEIVYHYSQDSTEKKIQNIRKSIRVFEPIWNWTTKKLFDILRLKNSWIKIFNLLRIWWKKCTR